MFNNLKKTVVDNTTKNYQLLKSIAIDEIEKRNIYEKYFPIEKNDIVVDVGAHVGIFTKKCIPLASTIYAIEPDPLFLKELEENTQSNNVKIINAALSYKTGKSKITSDGNPNSIGDGDVEIETFSFKDFCKKQGIKKIDFLKLDCEGGEYDILARENMEWVKKNVKKIAGELHVHTKKGKNSAIYLLQLFEDYEMDVIITTVDSVYLHKDRFLEDIEKFNEVLFYVLPNSKFNIEPKFAHNFYEGCYLEVLDGNDKYTVEFIDQDNDEIVYSTVLYKNEWGKAGLKYCINWKILVKNSKQEVVFEKSIDFNDKTVMISLTSKSLGDMLAWFPYVEEFRKLHNCKILCSVHDKSLFEENYKNITFIEPGSVHDDIYAHYQIGWFFAGDEIDRFYHPINPKTQPMQKTATDILGIVYKEIKPFITKPKVNKERIVGIGFHSTLQAKYWNNPIGWQTVVNYINAKEYVPLILSNEEDGYRGNYFPENVTLFGQNSIEQVIEQLCKCTVFIGIGSGLSWLAWACGVPVILISGFSEAYTEMSDCYRIDAPRSKCRGCFNMFNLDRGDWNWCPVHKDTDRQYECSVSIKPEKVIEILKQLL